MATENTSPTVNDRIISMMDRKGFIQLFWDEWSTGNYRTHEETYNALEKEYQSVMKRRRYSSFLSFKRRRDE